MPFIVPCLKEHKPLRGSLCLLRELCVIKSYTENHRVDTESHREK